MKFIHLLLAIFLAGSLVPAFPLPGSGLHATVAAQVWQDTANGLPADLLVTLRPQADVNAAAAAARAAGEDPDIRVVQALQQTARASQAALMAELEARGIPYQSYWIANIVALRASQPVVDFLASRPDILRIDSNRTFAANLEPAPTPAVALPSAALTASIEPNLVQVQAPSLWAMGITGQGIVYGNADTGVQWDHPALKDEYRGWNGTTADHNYNWWDAMHAADGWTSGYVNCPADSQAPCDDFSESHGTHTTGTGVGLDTASGHSIGMAPGAKWIACRNMFGPGGIGRPSSYAECLEFMMSPWPLNATPPYIGDATKHANIISNSYYCPASEGCPSDAFAQAAAAVHAAGIFMAVSAGNYFHVCGGIADPPAIYPGMFTVGAVDGSNTIAFFSNLGPITYNGVTRLGPDLVAPGVSILSSIHGNSYTSLSGTSMSAPHVAGAVALLWSAYPSLRGNVTATEALLKSSALPHKTNILCGTDTLDSIPNNTYGSGLLQVFNAYLANMPPRIYFPLAYHN